MPFPPDVCFKHNLNIANLILWKVKQQFHDAGLMADVDVDPGCTLNKKIRNAQLAQYNFILGKRISVQCVFLAPFEPYLL